MQRCGNCNGGYLNPISRYQNFGFFGGIAITATAWLARQWLFPPPGNEVTIRAHNFTLLLELFQNISGSTVSNFEQAKQVIENTVKKVSDLESIDRVFDAVNPRIIKIWGDLYTDKTEMFVSFALSSMNTTRTQEDLVRLTQSCPSNPSDYLKCTISKNEFDSGLLNISQTNALNVENQQKIDEFKSQLTNKQSEIDRLTTLSTTKQSEIDRLTTLNTTKQREIDRLTTLSTTKQGEIDSLRVQLSELTTKAEKEKYPLFPIVMDPEKVSTKDISLITIALKNKWTQSVVFVPHTVRAATLTIGGGQPSDALISILLSIADKHPDNLELPRAIEQYIHELSNQKVPLSSWDNLVWQKRCSEVRAKLLGTTDVALFTRFPDLEQFVTTNGITTLPIDERKKIFRYENQTPELFIGGNWHSWPKAKEKLKSVMDASGIIKDMKITENGLSSAIP